MVPMHSTAVDALLEVIFISRGFYWICSEGFFSDNHSDCSHILAQSQNIIHFRNSRIN